MKQVNTVKNTETTSATKAMTALAQQRWDDALDRPEVTAVLLAQRLDSALEAMLGKPAVQLLRLYVCELYPDAQGYAFISEAVHELATTEGLDAMQRAVRRAKKGLPNLDHCTLEAVTAERLGFVLP